MVVLALVVVLVVIDLSFGFWVVSSEVDELSFCWISKSFFLFRSLRTARKLEKKILILFRNLKK